MILGAEAEDAWSDGSSGGWKIEHLICLYPLLAADLLQFEKKRQEQPKASGAGGFFSRLSPRSRQSMERSGSLIGDSEAGEQPDGLEVGLSQSMPFLLIPVRCD